jgi:hypothetical protein
MKEVFANVDDVFARMINIPGGNSMRVERFDPGKGVFVPDPKYLTKLLHPEHAGVDHYCRMSKEEFESKIKELSGS